MKKQEVLEQLDSIYDNSKDMSKSKYASEVWEQDMEAIDYAVGAIHMIDDILERLEEMPEKNERIISYIKNRLELMEA